jgi:hypothetical protein
VIDHVSNNTWDPTPTDLTEPRYVVDFPASAAGSPPFAGTVPAGTPVCTTTPTTPVPTDPTTTPSPTDPSTTPTDPTTTPTVPTDPTTTATPTVPTTPTGAAPSNLRGTATNNSATLTWSGDAGATYEILRGEDGVKIASVTGTTFTDGGLNLNTPYVYSVRGAGVTTPQIVVTPGVSPSTPPTTGGTGGSTTSPPTTTPGTPSGAPSNLHKNSQTSSSVTLGWTGSATASYDILRGEDGIKIATVTGTTFTDIGLLPRTPYVYSVRGTGGTSPQITVTLS